MLLYLVIVVLRGSFLHRAFHQSNQILDKLLAPLLFPIRTIVCRTLAVLERIRDVPVPRTGGYGVQLAAFYRRG